MNQMRTAFIVAVTLFIGVLSGTAQKSDQGEVLLQKAIHKETVEGKLEEAIQIYKEVHAASKDNRALAAKALVQMGQCYEKLGNAEARKAYEQVIKEFPDQEQQAQAARAKLAALGAPEAKPKFTKIRVPTKLPWVTAIALSPDGQQLAYASDGAVWLVPVHGTSDPEIAGAPRRITEPIPTWGDGLDIAWSRDGRWLVLHVEERPFQASASETIYLVPSRGGEPRKVSLAPPKHYDHKEDERIGLSPDGKWLAYPSRQENEDELRNSIYIAPTSGGPARMVTPPISNQPGFSPDGKKIAYGGLVADPEGDPERFVMRQVWVTDVAGGTPVLIFEQPAPGRLRSPVWSPDGKMVAFLATMAKLTDDCDLLYIAPIGPDGRLAGPAAKIELPQLTWEKLAGWGTDNNIALEFFAPELTAIYTVPASGGKASQLTPKNGLMPSWTPDGKRIYFFGSQAQIESVPASGGSVSRIPMRGPRPLGASYPTGGVSVSPEGARILFAGRFNDAPAPAKNVAHLFTVPIDGGEVTDITDLPWVSQPCWSPDGKQIAFVRSEEQQKDVWINNIYTMPVGGGSPRRLGSESDKVMESRLAWSPDAKYIAYYSEDDKLKLAPVNGGPSKVLVEGLKGYLRYYGLAWSPDGKELAYVTRERIWKLNLETGKSEQVQTGLDADHLQLAWSPDGKTIAFSARQGGDRELWLMSDFLPLLKSAR